MYSWKTALITLAIFALGGLAGSLITAHVIKDKIVQVKDTSVPADVHNPDYVPRMARVMEVQLKLTPEQVKQARAILRKTQMELRKLSEEWQQKVEELDPAGQPFLTARNEWRIKSRRLFVKSDEEVRGLLTPEQFPLFEDFIKRRRQLMLPNREPGPLQRWLDRPRGALP